MADFLDEDESDNARAVALDHADGRAAILLVESLIHCLVERSVLTIEDAIDVVDVATDVSKELSADRGEELSAGAKSLASLEGIRRSLQADVNGRGGPG